VNFLACLEHENFYVRNMVFLVCVCFIVIHFSLLFFSMYMILLFAFSLFIRVFAVLHCLLPSLRGIKIDIYDYSVICYR